MAVVIERNLDAIKAVDWIIVVGPEGCVRGGQVIVEDIVKVKKSFTGHYLKAVLEAGK
ncbi:hypothetical protein WBP07_10150 [Novosphingobium sp. BL-8A]|uniref:hypothetical protein n=1 Tax=Novosphingobium sp. BL-8A TaxID=3127639 RepID=UPI0037570E86